MLADERARVVVQYAWLVAGVTWLGRPTPPARIAVILWKVTVGIRIVGIAVFIKAFALTF